MARRGCQKKWHFLIPLDASVRIEKDPASACANTGIERGLVVWYHQAGESLVGVPPLDKPLVHGGGASSGVGNVFEAGDELGQFIAGLLLGLAPHLVTTVLPSDHFSDVGVQFLKLGT